MILKEPNVIIGSSILFVLLGIPIITLGIALSVALYYCSRNEAGYTCTMKQAIVECRGRYFQFLLMGIIDLFVLGLAFGSLMMLISADSTGLKFIYAIALNLDLLFLFSGFFRYPILVRDKTNIQKVLGLGISLSIAHLGWLFLYQCVALMLFILSALTGLGLIFLLPGALAMLSYVALNETANFYTKEKSET